MRRITPLAVSFGLVAALAGAQARPTPPPPPAPAIAPALPQAPLALKDFELKLGHLGPAVLSLDALKGMDLATAGLDARMAEIEAALASADVEFDLPQAVVTARAGQGYTVRMVSGDYDRGTSALDSGRYDRAIEAFDKVIAANAPKADGAMYWKAYALNRLGKRTEALAAIDDLVKKFPSSRWSADAKALRIDVQRATGQPVQPEQTSDEELKLIALNGLVASDPDRGIPMVEQILNGSASPRMKERALFVLAQSASPRAKALLADFARGKGNPDLQLKALDYLGAFKGGPDVQLLLDVYKSTTDVDVKTRVIRSLGSAGRRGIGFGYGLGVNGGFEVYAQTLAASERAMVAAQKSLELAKVDLDRNPAQKQGEQARVEIEKARAELLAQSKTTAEREKDREARAKAAGDALWQLYQGEPSIDLKREILRNLRFTTQADHLLQIARTETNPLLRQSAVQGLLVDRTPQSAETMLALYKSEKDPAVRRQIFDSVASMPGSTATLVQMARQETDLALRKRIVERLSTMKDKEAVDYMMEILKK